jgi:hypothetical protein
LPDVIILGGGLTGLAAAWELERLGVDYALIEVKRRLGGSIYTERRDGFVLDGGAFISEKYGEWGFLAELGLGDSLIHMGVYRDGELVAFRHGTQSLVDALATKITHPIYYRMAGSSIGMIEGGRCGVCLITDNFSPDGGGIINFGELTVEDCKVMGNRGWSGGGIATYGANAETTITGSIIAQNEASTGAGVYNREGETVVNSSKIYDNFGGDGHAVTNDISTQVDAKNNWWGKASAPAASEIVGNVDTSNYQTSEPTPVTYWYSRRYAAKRAANAARNNFATFGTSLEGDARLDNDAAQNFFDDLRYSSIDCTDYGQDAAKQLWYRAANVLDHRSDPSPSQNSTGSSIFISEMIHRGGGIGMAKGVDGDASCPSSETDPIEIG